MGWVDWVMLTDVAEWNARVAWGPEARQGWEAVSELQVRRKKTGKLRHTH